MVSVVEDASNRTQHNGEPCPADTIAVVRWLRGDNARQEEVQRIGSDKLADGDFLSKNPNFLGRLASLAVDDRRRGWFHTLLREHSSLAYSGLHRVDDAVLRGLVEIGMHRQAQHHVG